MIRAAPRLSARLSGRDNHFNLIRMIAATGVLVSHAYPIALGRGTEQPLQTWLGGTTLGTVSVYVFFAISGFFIAKSFEASGTWRRFLRARVLRLFPALGVVLCVTLLVGGLWVTTAPIGVYLAEAPAYLLRNLALFPLKYDLPGVFETTPYGPAINGSLWTLRHEVLCYMGVFVAGLAGILRAPRVFALALAAVIALYLAAPHLPLPGLAAAFVDLALPFAFGTALYVWRDSIPLSPVLALVLALIAALASGTALFDFLFVLALSYGVFVLGLARSPALLAYNRLGDYSYGMYIYAFPLQQLAAQWGVREPGLNMLVALPLTLICAILSWHLIEKPALARVRPAHRDATQKAMP